MSTAIIVPPHTPLVIVPIEERFGAETSPPKVKIFGNDVVAASLASKRLLVQKIFELPSTRVSVFMPREDVAIVPTAPSVPKSSPDNEPTDKLVALAFVAKKLLDVALVDVAFVELSPVIEPRVAMRLLMNPFVVVPFTTFSFPTSEVEIVAFVVLKLVVVAFVAIKLMTAALVPARFVVVALEIKAFVVVEFPMTA